MLNSNSINKFISRENFELFIEGSRRGIEDLIFYKIKFEREIKVPNYEFEFKYFTYPLIKVYGSASFTIYEDIRTPFEERPLKYVFIHLIPRADSLKIIVGYNKHLSKKSIADFVSSWDGLSKTELELKLTNLFATRIENWGMSQSIFKNIDAKLKNKFLAYFEENTMNYLENQSVSFNLFNGNNYRT